MTVATEYIGHYLSSLGSSDTEEYPWVPLLILRREESLLRVVLTTAGSSFWGLRSNLAWRVNPELNLQAVTYTYYYYTLYHIVVTHLFLRCWILPRHLKDPLTMIASLVHSASHSSILYIQCNDAYFVIIAVFG